MSPSSVERASAPRVVVTGIGPVTPVGVGVDAFWEGMRSGRNGIGPIERFDPSDLPVRLAGEVRDFQPTDWMEVKEARHTGRFTGCRARQRSRAAPRSAPILARDGLPPVGTVRNRAQVDDL